MARHSSVSRKDRNLAKKQALIGKALSGMVGDNKRLKFTSSYDRLLADAQRDIGLRQKLNAEVDMGGERAVTARRKLRELRDVKYYVDADTKPGDLFNDPLGNHKPRLARGSSGKHDNLLRGKAARDNQGKGI